MAKKELIVPEEAFVAISTLSEDDMNYIIKKCFPLVNLMSKFSASELTAEELSEELIEEILLTISESNVLTKKMLKAMSKFGTTISFACNIILDANK